MWEQLIQTFKELMRATESPEELKEQMVSTMSRLRATSRPTYQITGQSHGVLPTPKPVSLFHSIAHARKDAMSERQSVGHWYTMSVSASREVETKLAERAYDIDFRSNIDPQGIDLQTLLSKTASKKALASYMQDDRAFKPTAAPAPIQKTAQQNTSNQNTSNQNTTNSPSLEDTLDNLAHSEEEAVRISVASNRYLPVGTMWMLVEDSSSAVKLELIQNTRVCIAMLEHLSNDNDQVVARKSQSKLRKLYKDQVGIATGNLSSDAEVEAENRKLQIVKIHAA